MRPTLLAIERDHEIHNILRFGYTSDGGFFIQGPHFINKQYFVAKFKVNNDVYQQHTWNNKNAWITSNQPKITHHIDGVSHVSGIGLKSGFFKLSNKPKGVYVQSFDLRTLKNDGGPFSVVAAWGIEHYPSKGLKKNQVIFKQKDLFNSRGFYKTKGSVNAYAIEAFYLPKYYMRFVNVVNSTIRFLHRTFGPIDLKIFPAPSNAPGFIAVGVTDSLTDFVSNYGISFGGGPGQKDKNGHWDIMQIVHPADEFFINSKTSKFDLTYLDQVIYKIDSLVYKIFARVKKIFGNF